MAEAVTAVTAEVSPRRETIGGSRATDHQALLRQFARNSDWFQEHADDVLEQYADQFVAVYGRRIVAASPDYDELLRQLPPECDRRVVFIELAVTEPAAEVVCASPRFKGSAARYERSCYPRGSK